MDVEQSTDGREALTTDQAMQIYADAHNAAFNSPDRSTRWWHEPCHRAGLSAVISAARLQSPVTEEALAQTLYRTLFDAGVSFESGTVIPRLTATIRSLGYRAASPVTEPTEPSDEMVEAAAQAGHEHVRALRPAAHGPYPEWANENEPYRQYLRDIARAQLVAAARIRKDRAETNDCGGGSTHGC